MSVKKNLCICVNIWGGVKSRNTLIARAVFNAIFSSLMISNNLYFYIFFAPHRELNQYETEILSCKKKKIFILLHFVWGLYSLQDMRKMRKNIKIKITVPEYCCIILIKVIYFESKQRRTRNFFISYYALKRVNCCFKPAILVVPVAIEEVE